MVLKKTVDNIFFYFFFFSEFQLIFVKKHVMINISKCNFGTYFEIFKFLLTNSPNFEIFF